MCPEARIVEFLLFSTGMILIFLAALNLTCATACVPKSPLITSVQFLFAILRISSSIII